MNNKVEIIETDQYWIGVSSEKIKEDDWCLYNANHNSRNPKWEIIKCGKIEREEMYPHSNDKLLLWMVKIVAYQTKGNAPELDLPLLHEIFVEYDDLLDTEIQVVGDDKTQSIRNFLNLPDDMSKVYSEEDLRRVQQAILCNQRDAAMNENYAVEYMQSFREYEQKERLAHIYNMNKIEDYDFNKNDWNHFHDVVLDATREDGRLSLTQEEMESLFWELPESLRKMAYVWGMNDTPWRDKFYDWYEQNKMKK